MGKSTKLNGTLDLLLLAVLSSGPAHGYAVIEQLRARSDGQFDLLEGTVYPALHRLEREGFLSSDWVAGSTRRRRVYAITATGAETLIDDHGKWQKFVSSVESVLNGVVPA